MLRVVFVCLMLFLPVFNAEAACDRDTITTAFSRVVGDIEVDSIGPSVIPGFCEAVIGAWVFYVSETGDYLFSGGLISLKSGENLTERRTRDVVRGIIAKVKDEEMIRIGPDKPRREITVFTDVDCPYCARLHEEVPRLNAAGVRIRYLLYPRNGMGTATYRKSVAVWCADDRVKAIGIAKAGGSVPSKDCPNPVDAHYQLGQKLGVTGTPTMFTDRGDRIGGYVPADRLLQMLGIAPE
jgi:thiol:disulfide interchange protein DsbC